MFINFILLLAIVICLSFSDEKEIAEINPGKNDISMESSKLNSTYAHEESDFILFPMDKSGELIRSPWLISDDEKVIRKNRRQEFFGDNNDDGNGGVMSYLKDDYQEPLFKGENTFDKFQANVDAAFNKQSHTKEQPITPRMMPGFKPVLLPVQIPFLQRKLPYGLLKLRPILKNLPPTRLREMFDQPLSAFDIVPLQELPPGELPPGELPPGELPPGELPPGELPSGPAPEGPSGPAPGDPSGGLPPGEIPPGVLPPGENPPGEIPPGHENYTDTTPQPKHKHKKHHVNGTVTGQNGTSSNASSSGETETEVEYYDDDEVKNETTTTDVPTPPGETVDEEGRKDRSDEAYYIKYRDMEALPEPVELSIKKTIVELEHIPACRCPRVYWPVCGRDHITYMNVCVMKCMRKKLRRYGPCINYRRTDTKSEDDN